MKYGILGPISGKLGPVTAGIWKGIPYLKITPDEPKEKQPRTEAQLANEQKFKFGNEWMVPFQPYMAIGFQNLAIGKTSIAAAFSENYKVVITGTWPNIVIDYSKVVISKGDLPGVLEAEVAFVSPGMINIQWKMDDPDGAAFDDQILLVVYSAELGYADGSIGGAIRRDLECNFRLHPKLVGQTLEVYIGVTSFDRKKVADSVYLGRIEP